MYTACALHARCICALQAFEKACDRFRAAGFHFGDPAAYFHAPGHAHNATPDFQHCEACNPPVHGEVLLLRCQPAGEGEGEGKVGGESGGGSSVACIVEYGGTDASRLALQQARRESTSSGGNNGLRLATSLYGLRELISDQRTPRPDSCLRGAHGWCIQMALAFVALAVLAGGVPIVLALTLYPVEDI